MWYSILPVLLAACGGGGSNSVPNSADEPRILASSSVVGSSLYVDPAGSDGNAGTKAAPFKTIAAAAQHATAGTSIYVAAGSYEGGFQTSVSGTAAAHIHFVSTTKWAAKIVPPASSNSDTAWDNRGNYIDIDGFEVDGSKVPTGTQWLTGIYSGGSFDVVENNHVHHIAKTASCPSGGGGGVGLDSYYGGVNNDAVSNVVNDIGPVACATMYGIYVSTSGSAVNNLVYSISDTAIRLWHDANHVVVANNTLFASGAGVLVGGGDYYHSTGPDDYTQVVNNIVFDNAKTGIAELGSTGTHNLYSNNLSYQNGAGNWSLHNGLSDAHAVTANPAFVNYVRAGGGDYHLASVSPAIDKGTANDAPLTDLDGSPRPAGAGYDIGAYELQSAATPTPSPTPTPTPTPITSHNLYVATTGSDSNSGTEASPLKTIARASQMAVPDTTIFVAAGTYEGGFQTLSSGTAAGQIYYVSRTPGAAKLVPPSSSTRDTAWDNRGNYVQINGFEIDGSVVQSGTKWSYGIYSGGSYDTIRNNNVHHIATTVSCTSAGGSGIGIDSYYGGVSNDILANLVHDIGPAGCSFIQGIYVSTSGTVKNNIVYRIAEAAIHLWHDANHVIIANNTVSQSDTGIIIGGGDYYNTSGPDDYTDVSNNIVFDNRYGISEQGSTGTHNTYTNNLVFLNSSYNWSLHNSLSSVAGVAADPLFVNYTRSGTPDFHLRSGSPAIGAGSPTYAPSTDFSGIARSLTTGYDIGALQH